MTTNYVIINTKEKERVMPYIHARLNVNLDDAQKADLQSKMTDIVSEAFSKPKNYIMAEIADGCSLYMGGKGLDKGAYISIGLLGSTTKDRCSLVTQKICGVLNTDYGMSGSSVYITYHPTELWGWNGMMF